MAYFAPYIDETGLHMPTYEERLQDLAEAYRSIFGLEAELSEAVPDYQLLSVFARALDDTSALVLQAYNSRNPLYASGAALDLLLPQYGLTRNEGETDAEARERIRTSLAGRGTATSDALAAAVRAIPNVRKMKAYINDADSADGNGIPGHSVAVVVQGGNAARIAETIWNKKAPGIGTCGSTTETVTDGRGETHEVSFSRSSAKMVYVYFTIKRLPGCDDEAVAGKIKPAVTEFINNSLGIAEPLIVPQLYAVAYAAAADIAGTFAVSDIQVAVSGDTGTATREKVDCAWNEKISTNNIQGVNFEFLDFA